MLAKGFRSSSWHHETFAQSSANAGKLHLANQISSCSTPRGKNPRRKPSQDLLRRKMSDCSYSTTRTKSPPNFFDLMLSYRMDRKNQTLVLCFQTNILMCKSTTLVCSSRGESLSKPKRMRKLQCKASSVEARNSALANLSSYFGRLHQAIHLSAMPTLPRPPRQTLHVDDVANANSRLVDV